MPHAWALQDAKNRLSEVVDRAVGEGPQLVTRRGEAVAVILSVAEYRRLTGSGADLVDLLLAAPTVPELEVQRDRSPGRAVVFE
jgi:antitoxin Phd